MAEGSFRLTEGFQTFHSLPRDVFFGAWVESQVKRRQREIRKRAILAMEGCDDECRLDVFSMYDHDQEGSATTGWMSVFTTEQSRTKAHPTPEHLGQRRLTKPFRGEC